MSYPSESVALVSRYTDGDTLGLERRIICPSPILPITLASRSPQSSPPWDISSESSAAEESGFVPDAPTTEPIPAEQIGFGGMYYDQVQHGHYHHHDHHHTSRWEFSDARQGHGAPPRILEHPVGVPVMPSPQAAGTREEFTRPLRRHGSDEISYTDEANTKLSNRIRRQCFNCKATETSTWRRSVLSPGKLLCNKCGLFERTHGIPRPQKFPRRRTHSSKAAVVAPRPLSEHPDLRASGFVHRHSKDPHSNLPVTAHLVHALDPISGEIFPQHMPWNSPPTPDSASVRLHPTTTEQPAMNHANDGQLPPMMLPGAIWTYGHASKLTPRSTKTSCPCVWV